MSSDGSELRDCNEDTTEKDKKEIEHPIKSRSPLVTRNELYTDHLRERSKEMDKLNFIKLNMVSIS